MAKHLDPKADITFKKVFGEHKELFTELSENYGCPQWILNDENVVIFIDKYADILSVEGIYYSIDKYWNQISRERTAVNAAENKGRAEGREEGLAKGREEGEMKKALAIASNLLSIGMPITQISQVTGLTEEEINNL